MDATHLDDGYCSVYGCPHPARYRAERTNGLTGTPAALRYCALCCACVVLGIGEQTAPIAWQVTRLSDEQPVEIAAIRAWWEQRNAQDRAHRVETLHM